MITTLEPGQIFVFGSNLQGIHGKGAALQAVSFGAKRGIGVGLSGQTYAIPTRTFVNKKIITLPLNKINNYVKQFLEFAGSNYEYEFLLTPIGTGLAGYTVDQIAPMFVKAPNNVTMPEEFLA